MLVFSSLHLSLARSLSSAHSCSPFVCQNDLKLVSQKCQKVLNVLCHSRKTRTFFIVPRIHVWILGSCTTFWIPFSMSTESMTQRSTSCPWTKITNIKTNKWLHKIHKIMAKHFQMDHRAKHKNKIDCFSTTATMQNNNNKSRIRTKQRMEEERADSKRNAWSCWSTHMDFLVFGLLSQIFQWVSGWERNTWTQLCNCFDYLRVRPDTFVHCNFNGFQHKVVFFLRFIYKS